MIKITRRNRLGMVFTLTTEKAGKQTVISLDSNKSLTVNHHMVEILASWNNWLRGQFIQDAFHYLTVDEREFILSGTTPEEWDEMFNQKEN